MNSALSAYHIDAFETGLPTLRFGCDMAPGFKRAPWEIYCNPC